MSSIISISNQKGGVGKTTTAINLAASLAAAEKRTLLVDMDPQGNASSGVGVFRDQVKQSIYHALIGEADVVSTVLPTAMPNLFLIPSNEDLIGFEMEFLQAPGREAVLKEVLGKIKDQYDYIILDCPPSLSLLTLNSLTACDQVLIPLQCEYYALEGLSALMRTVELVKQAYNPNMVIEGIVLTMFDGRNRLAKQVMDDVAEHFPEKLYRAIIPRNVRLSESPSHGKPVLLYDATCSGAKSYFEMAEEFMNRQRVGGAEKIVSPLSDKIKTIPETMA